DKSGGCYFSLSLSLSLSRVVLAAAQLLIFLVSNLLIHSSVFCFPCARIFTLLIICFY
ncbi:unnamed protein product, partial [Prunus brigantina]